MAHQIDSPGRAAARQLLSDMRELVERLGPLGALVLAAYEHQRVAVVAGDDPRSYAYSEFEARRRGFELRYFGDVSSALTWLNTKNLN
ncbi:MAG TPA: hypothetical protein VGJ74_00485 [Burkholderiales bacterium]